MKSNEEWSLQLWTLFVQLHKKPVEVLNLFFRLLPQLLHKLCSQLWLGRLNCKQQHQLLLGGFVSSLHKLIFAVIGHKNTLRRNRSGNIWVLEISLEKTLYQNILRKITFFFTHFKSFKCNRLNEITSKKWFLWEPKKINFKFLKNWENTGKIAMPDWLRLHFVKIWSFWSLFSQGSHKNLYFGVILYYLLQPPKSVEKNATWLQLFWYKIFVHWKLKLPYPISKWILSQTFLKYFRGSQFCYFDIKYFSTKQRQREEKITACHFNNVCKTNHKVQNNDLLSNIYFNLKQ